jgi:hypothetical protein
VEVCDQLNSGSVSLNTASACTRALSFLAGPCRTYPAFAGFHGIEEAQEACPSGGAWRLSPFLLTKSTPFFFQDEKVFFQFLQNLRLSVRTEHGRIGLQQFGSKSIALSKELAPSIDAFTKT